MSTNDDIIEALKISGGYIKAPELSKKLNIREPSLRVKINALRAGGVPIVSTNKGYKLTNDITEIEGMILQYRKRATKMLKAMQGLEKCKRSLQRKEKLTPKANQPVRAELFLLDE